MIYPFDLVSLYFVVVNGATSMLSSSKIIAIGYCPPVVIDVSLRIFLKWLYEWLFLISLPDLRSIVCVRLSPSDRIIQLSICYAL